MTKVSAASGVTPKDVVCILYLIFNIKVGKNW